MTTTETITLRQKLEACIHKFLIESNAHKLRDKFTEEEILAVLMQGVQGKAQEERTVVA